MAISAWRTSGAEQSRPRLLHRSQEIEKARKRSPNAWRPLLAQLFGGAVPIRFVFWDGSALGREDGSGTVVLRSARVVTQLIWSPDELGVARSFVTGDIDIDGSLSEVLATLRAAMSGARRLDVRELAEWPEGSAVTSVRCAAALRDRPRKFVSWAGVIKACVEMLLPSSITTTSATTSIASSLGRR